MRNHTHDESDHGHGELPDELPDELHDHDRGLGFDLATLDEQRTRHRGRRAVLGLMGVGAAGLGGAVLLGAGGLTGAASAATLDEIPSETAGPYPGDGSNGPDLLSQSGVVRRDITTSFGTASGTAPGVPFRFSFVLEDTATGDPVEGLAVYAWHCNRDGKYSMYDVADQNYLRGVQVTNRRGRVHFRSIYPAAYSGRWPHVHFEVYRSRAAATGGGELLVTSQLALPRKQSMHVYRQADGYEASVANLERISLGTDNVFGDDGGVSQLATVTGSIGAGYHAKLVVPVDV